MTGVIGPMAERYLRYFAIEPGLAARTIEHEVALVRVFLSRGHHRNAIISAPAR